MRNRISRGNAFTVVALLGMLLSFVGFQSPSSSENVVEEGAKIERSVYSGHNVTFFGAADGSNAGVALVKSGEAPLFLVDCGVPKSQAPSLQLPSEAMEVEALFLSHAGSFQLNLLTQLLDQGFNGRVFTSVEVKEAMSGLLNANRSSLSQYSREWEWSSISSSNREFNAHWVQECPWRQKIKESNSVTFHGTNDDLIDHFEGYEVRECKVCAQIESDQIIQRIETISLYTPNYEKGVFSFRAFRIDRSDDCLSYGFSLGAGDSSVHLLFVHGNIGVENPILFRDAFILPRADFVFLSSMVPQTIDKINSLEQLLGNNHDSKIYQNSLLGNLDLKSNQGLLGFRHVEQFEWGMPVCYFVVHELDY